MWATQRVSSETQFEPPGACSPYWVGVNAIFLPLIPYTIATALHDTHVHLAFILGTAFSGGIILFGLLCRLAGGYRVSGAGVGHRVGRGEGTRANWIQAGGAGGT